ncbi:Gfo/Idh/MocA family oxidoreductase [Enterococcus timonensis]|uniref:Gfo/Idh/MocA family oxidoreductase n=1 Tax=Enterococcus timonensis TaxID=1852364 RepID=UPI0008D9C001|nr:Gfo/Idh/MocA family oxidoreductase [Enterococcus timonensis]
MKKRYVQVGTGGRARFYYDAIATTFKETSEIVGFCDLSQTRMDYANRRLEENGHPAVPTYIYTDFEKMLDETKPDFVIVTSVDRTHDHYITTAMEKGYDVITEKPMTIDEKKAQEIIDCQKRTGRNLRVTFNYRYAPHNSKIRELIAAGTIGDVFSVHFEWLLNTKHGADYFRRWHRNKYNSGGLLVHKSTHHFDLVNFWLGTTPQTVFAFGDLNFYGMKNAEKRGMHNFYYRATGNPVAQDDPFALDLNSSPDLKALYLDAEKDSGYLRDRSVFSDDISIEDTMSVLVKYNNGAQMSYSLNAYQPWEGYNVVFNGSRGRIEMKVVESSYVNAGGKQENEGAAKIKSIKVFPMFGAPYEVEIEEKNGGHGGGDPVLLNDIFGVPEEDPLHRAAGLKDGAMSILTGVAANKAIASGLPVKISDLVDFHEE